MKEPIVPALASILMVGMVGNAFAFFQQTSAPRTVVLNGTLNLKVRASKLDWADSVTTFEWTLPNLKPTESTDPAANIRNSASLQAGPVEISCSYSTTSPLGTNSDPGDGREVASGPLDPTSAGKEVRYLPLIVDGEGNGGGEVLDVFSDSDDRVEPVSLNMTCRFNHGAGDDFQAELINLVVKFAENEQSTHE